MKNDTANSLVVNSDFGFEDGDEQKLTKGLPILRCVDGMWSVKNGPPIAEDAKLLVLGTGRGLQRWDDKKLVDEFVKGPHKDLPDVDELNAAIPEAQWSVDKFTGKPRPPWAKYFAAYLIDPDTGAQYCFVNCTAGTAKAVREIERAVRGKRAINGSAVAPVVKLSRCNMPTQYGVKQRPMFELIGWYGGGGDNGAALGTKPAKQIEHKSAELNDEIPW